MWHGGHFLSRRSEMVAAHAVVRRQTPAGFQVVAGMVQEIDEEARPTGCMVECFGRFLEANGFGFTLACIVDGVVDLVDFAAAWREFSAKYAVAHAQ